MSQKTENGIFKNISVAFMILVIHVLLVGVIGILAIFFGWMAKNAGWIILGISLITIIGGYWFYRRMKSDGKVIKGVLGESSLNGKNVEISFLGGLATFKVGDSKAKLIANEGPLDSVKELEAPKIGETGTLPELARLYEKKLITLEEYNKAKQKILK